MTVPAPDPYVSHTESEALIPNQIVSSVWRILTISPQDDFGDVRKVALRFGWTVEVHPDCPPGHAYFSEQGFHGR